MITRTAIRAVLMTFLAMAFAGRPAVADSSHARIIRLSLVQGDVRFARDVHGDALTSDKAIWEAATLNLPIRQGYVLATDQGRAEVEFENGAMAFLAENTVLEFYDLSLEDGAKTTRLVLRQGTASFYVNAGGGDYFSVTGGDFTVESEGRAGFRLNNFDDGSTVDVTKGHVSVLRKNKTTELAKGQSLSMRADDNNSMEIVGLPESDDFDRWVSGRESAELSATAAAQQYVSSPYYSSGMADLYTYGSWYPVGGYGNCWRPYGAGLGWSPFAGGNWFMDPWYGWSFVGAQPWGWLPYHYGGWIFDPFYGWLWSPGLGFGGGFGRFAPFRPVTGVFLRSKTGLLGLVPMHPLDVRGKEPINMAKGIFPVAGGAVAQQAMAGASAGEGWKVMKAAPRESFTNTAVMASSAPMRVSRTMVGGGSNARVVTLDRNSSIAYDAREHRFVNSGSAPQNAESKTAGKTSGTTESLTGERTTQGRVQASAPAAGNERVATGNVRVPTASARGVTPPSRAMAPPPRPSSGGSGGGWSSGGGSSRGASAGASHASPSAGASHPSSSGHPH